MIQNSQYRAIPTDLQLNGPILSFTTTPSDTTLGVGQSAYFTGIATAQFPTQVPANPAVGFATGTIQYQWYEVTEGQLSDGTKYVGTATTELVISDIVSPDDNGKQYYLSADYVAIGTSPNANNESFTSSRATLSIYPEIRITEHPADTTVGLGGQSTFEVEAELTDGTYGSLSYQWRVDGENLTDGTYTSESVATQGITSIEDDAVLSLPLNEDSGSVDLTDYSPNTKTITAGSLWGDGPTWVSTGIATGNFYGGAAYFNGSTSYLNVPASDDFYMGEGEWTIEAWIKWDDASWSDSWEVISCLGGGYYSDGGMWFAILRDTAAGENSKVYISNPQYYTQIATIDIQADEDVWQHTALTRADDGKIRLFINGVLKGTLSNDFSAGAFGGKTRGYIALENATFHTQGYYYPNFYLQDFRAYKGVAKYTIDFTPSSTSILGTSRNLTTFNTNFPASLALPLWNRTGRTNDVDITDISQYKNVVEFGTTKLTWDPDVTKWYDGAAKFPNENAAALSVNATNNLAFGTGDFTIEAWCYFNKTSWSDIFSTDDYNTFNRAFDNEVGGLFAFRKNSAEKLSFYCNPGFESSNRLEGGPVDGDIIPQNTWVHCAVTRQDGVVRTFLNGRFQGSHDFSPGGAGTTPNHSGGKPRVGAAAGNQYPMGGYIQDLIVYKGVAKYTEDFVVPRRSILSEDKTYTNISGAQTDTLTITSSAEGASKIDCVVSNPNTDSKVSNLATYVITDARSTIKLEGYGTSSDATLIEKNLDDSEFTITSSDLNFDDICLYASEKDLNVEIDMFAGRGSDTSNFSGGEGGYSRIQFTMKKDEEYILRGIKSDTALFLYRKASLISVVGEGGSAGNSGPGGDGGGVNVAGENAEGNGGGAGGLRIATGELGENGRFGSRSGIDIADVYPEDVKEESDSPSVYENFEGQTIKCSKGVYWRNQGKGACEDVGTVKFRLSDGTEVTNSAIIDRGFKAGYSINSTGAASGGFGGVGGHGTVGGTASASGFGGGGGSGYSDGSVTIAKTQVGGSTGSARINVRLSAGDFYIDDEGRILILSLATSGLDPRNLTKTTSKVLPNTNTCIDDIRWQRFIDSANANTNIRLAVTRNEDNRRILAVTSNNLYKMKVANRYPLRRSLTGWETWESIVGTGFYGPDLLLAWDETSGFTGTGGDYSGLYWNAPNSGYTVGFAYYGGSSNPPFVGSTYHFPTANWWILPDGVPDFS